MVDWRAPLRVERGLVPQLSEPPRLAAALFARLFATSFLSGSICAKWRQHSKGNPILHYVSTRGEAPTLGFADALLAGLARDGGLYVPHSLPHWSPSDIRALTGLSYAEAAARIILPFTGGDIGEGELLAMADAAYAGFRHIARAPVAQIDDNLFLAELFHGPTLAFKDFAMQLLGRMINYVLQQRGAHATIVGATSGDTGAAAIEAFGGQSQADVFILFPHGRVSEVQRRQMTTVNRPNVHALAIEGDFDDCQAIVKALFNDLPFRDALKLSGVNSINWARIVAQIVYYFTTAVALGAPGRNVSFAAPSGNFGNILAGYYAKKMGLGIDRLVIASNENDILTRVIHTGVYKTQGVTPTQSPSMDIQISSNFERLLFEAYSRDARAIRALMAQFAQSGEFSVARGPLDAIRRDFDAYRTSEVECGEEIGRVYRQTGILIDPHTAIGVHAARAAQSGHRATPMIALATAHPAKFPEAVAAASGTAAGLPDHLADILLREENFTVLPNERSIVADFIANRSRALA